MMRALADEDRNAALKLKIMKSTALVTLSQPTSNPPSSPRSLSSLLPLSDTTAMTSSSTTATTTTAAAAVSTDPSSSSSSAFQATEDKQQSPIRSSKKAILSFPVTPNGGMRGGRISRSSFQGGTTPTTNHKNLATALRTTKTRRSSLTAGDSRSVSTYHSTSTSGSGNGSSSFHPQSQILRTFLRTAEEEDTKKKKLQEEQITQQQQQQQGEDDEEEKASGSASGSGDNPTSVILDSGDTTSSSAINPDTHSTETDLSPKKQQRKSLRKRLIMIRAGDLGLPSDTSSTASPSMDSTELREAIKRRMREHQEEHKQQQQEQKQTGRNGSTTDTVVMMKGVVKRKSKEGTNDGDDVLPRNKMDAESSIIIEAFKRKMRESGADNISRTSDATTKKKATTTSTKYENGNSRSEVKDSVRRKSCNDSGREGGTRKEGEDIGRSRSVSRQRRVSSSKIAEEGKKESITAKQPGVKESSTPRSSGRRSSDIIPSSVEPRTPSVRSKSLVQKIQRDAARTESTKAHTASNDEGTKTPTTRRGRSRSVRTSRPDPDPSTPKTPSAREKSKIKHRSPEKVATSSSSAHHRGRSVTSRPSGTTSKSSEKRESRPPETPIDLSGKVSPKELKNARTERAKSAARPRTRQPTPTPTSRTRSLSRHRSASGGEDKAILQPIPSLSSGIDCPSTPRSVIDTETKVKPCLSNAFGLNITTPLVLNSGVATKVSPSSAQRIVRSCSFDSSLNNDRENGTDQSATRLKRPSTNRTKSDDLQLLRTNDESQNSPRRLAPGRTKSDLGGFMTKTADKSLFSPSKLLPVNPRRSGVHSYSEGLDFFSVCGNSTGSNEGPKRLAPVTRSPRKRLGGTNQMDAFDLTFEDSEKPKPNRSKSLDPRPRFSKSYSEGLDFFDLSGETIATGSTQKKEKPRISRSRSSDPKPRLTQSYSEGLDFFNVCGELKATGSNQKQGPAKRSGLKKSVNSVSRDTEPNVECPRQKDSTKKTSHSQSYSEGLDFFSAYDDRSAVTEGQTKARSKRTRSKSADSLDRGCKSVSEGLDYFNASDENVSSILGDKLHAINRRGRSRSMEPRFFCSLSEGLDLYSIKEERPKRRPSDKKAVQSDKFKTSLSNDDKLDELEKSSRSENCALELFNIAKECLEKVAEEKKAKEVAVANCTDILVCREGRVEESKRRSHDEIERDILNAGLVTEKIIKDLAAAGYRIVEI